MLSLRIQSDLLSHYLRSVLQSLTVRRPGKQIPSRRLLAPTGIDIGPRPGIDTLDDVLYAFLRTARRTSLALVIALITDPTAIAQDAAFWQKQAMKRYPTLGVAGTPLNTVFVARVAARKTIDPAFFNTPNWPMRLAQECFDGLGIQHEAGLRDLFKSKSFENVELSGYYADWRNIPNALKKLRGMEKYFEEQVKVRGMSDAVAFAQRLRAEGPGIYLNVTGKDSVGVPFKGVEKLLGLPDKVEDDPEDRTVEWHFYDAYAFKCLKTGYVYIHELRIFCDLLPR